MDASVRRQKKSEKGARARTSGVSIVEINYSSITDLPQAFLRASIITLNSLGSTSSCKLRRMIEINKVKNFISLR